MTKDEKLLKRARKRFDRVVEAESENRDRAREDLRFRYGDQWPEAALKKRENEQRPCLTVNKIPRLTRQVMNDIRQTRPAIKTRGIDSQADPDTAEAMNGLIRAIEQDSAAESAYDWATQYAIDMGWGYFRIDTDYESEISFDQVLKVGRIENPFSVYLDPDTTEQDRSDANYAFVIDHLDQEAFEAQYPNAVSEWPMEPSEAHKQRWYTKGKIRVAEYWERTIEKYELNQMMDGAVVRGDVGDEMRQYVVRTRWAEEIIVKQYIITGQEILEQTEWLGKYIPIVMVKGEEANIDGEQIYRGMVYDLKDSQRSYNYGRSAAAENVAYRSKTSLMGPRNSMQDPKWRNINTASYPYAEYDGEVPPQAIPQNGPDPKLIQEMMSSDEEMKDISGILDPALGESLGEVSGVAVGKRQKKSEISNYHFADNLGKALRHAGRIFVDIIPNIYDSERVVQILGIDGSEKLIKLNGAYIDSESGEQKIHDLTTGRYDVVVDIGPSFSTQRQEATEAMLEFVRASPETLQVTGDLIAKNMDWPESDELSKRFKMLLPFDIAAEENPQVRAILEENAQIIEQGKAYTQTLEAQIQSLMQALQDRDRELTVKEREQDRKEVETAQDIMTDRTEQELKYMANVPGAAV